MNIATDVGTIPIKNTINAGAANTIKIIAIVANANTST